MKKHRRFRKKGIIWQQFLAWIPVLLLIVPSVAWIVQPRHTEATSEGDGVLLWAAGSNTTPQLKNYSDSSNSFGSAASTVSGSQPRIVRLRTSPTKVEYIVGYADTAGNLQVMCYDGSSWSNEWSVSVGGTGTTRRFDISYETDSGDVVVAYSTGAAGTNALEFRTKSGSDGCGSANWSSATGFSTGTSTTTNIVLWVKAARDGRSSSDLSTFIWSDSNSDLGGAVWDGSTFTNFKLLETSLEVISAAGDVDDFEVQYESTSGDVMTVWASSVGTNGTQGAYYAVCTGGTSSCTWTTTPAKISTATGDDATNLDLTADPTSDKMAFASIGNAGSDLQAAYWSGSAWTFYANRDTTCELPTAGTRLVQTGWVTNNGNTKWIITFDDASGAGLSYFTAVPGSAPVVATDFTTSPAIGDIRKRYLIDQNPYDNAEMMLLVSDSTSGVNAELLSMDSSGNVSWSDANPGTDVATIATIPYEGFAFSYNRFVPATLYDQSGYRLYDNTDDAAAGSALAALNTSATLVAPEVPFRLRLLLHVSGNSSGVHKTFKLQYAARSGTCDTSFVGESYADVTFLTPIAYFPNITPDDGVAASSNGSDPTHSSDTIVRQTYEDRNNIVLTSDIPAGQDGLWDFTLIDNSAPASTAYCLRVVDSSGTALDTYSVVPEIITAATPTDPITNHLLRGGIYFDSGSEQTYFWSN